MTAHLNKTERDPVALPEIAALQDELAARGLPLPIGADGQVPVVESGEVVWGAGAGGGGAVDSVNGQTGAVVLDKSHVGLASVDNTSDLAKPVSSAQQAALDGKLSIGGGTLSGPLFGTTFSGDLLAADELIAGNASIENLALAVEYAVLGLGTGAELFLTTANNSIIFFSTIPSDETGVVYLPVLDAGDRGDVIIVNTHSTKSFTLTVDTEWNALKRWYTDPNPGSNKTTMAKQSSQRFTFDGISTWRRTG